MFALLFARGRERNGQLRESAIVPCIGVNPLSPIRLSKNSLIHPSIHSIARRLVRAGTHLRAVPFVDICSSPLRHQQL